MFNDDLYCLSCWLQLSWITMSVIIRDIGVLKYPDHLLLLPYIEKMLDIDDRRTMNRNLKITYTNLIE